MERIYFDNAATTCLAPEVLDAMMPFYTGYYGNPSSIHEEGRRARLAIETARKDVASLLGAKPGEIFFTSGGTESNNLAIRATVRDMHINHIITSRTEHHSVLNTVRDLHTRGQVSLSYVGLKNDGSIDLLDLDKLLEKGHGRMLVTLMHANNETGSMIDLELTGEMCRRYKAVFHSDTVQTIGHFDFDLADSKVDMLSASGHKFHGPKGTGILYIREGLEIKSITTGGGQERGVRAGTENVAGIAGFAKALDLAIGGMVTDRMHITLLKERLQAVLLKYGVHVNGSVYTDNLYTILNAAFPNNEQTESLLMELDMAGIAASGGSACSAGKGGSHVMEAIGASHNNNIRFSFSRYNTIKEVMALEAVLKHCLVNEFA